MRHLQQTALVAVKTALHHVCFTVCFENQMAVNIAEDLLISAAAPSSHYVIWRNAPPLVAHIDFWLCGFYIPAEFGTVSKDTPPLYPLTLLSVQIKYWWEDLGPFISFTSLLLHNPAPFLSLPYCFAFFLHGVYNIITFSVFVFVVHSSADGGRKNCIVSFVCVCI